MPGNRQSPRQAAYYFALSQVGFEMAAPIGVGYLVDVWLGLFPWLTISGAILGLVGGLYHLVAMTKNPPTDSQESDS